MARLHAFIVVGTRPEAIKLAPVIAECRRRCDEFRTTICFTGQHDELVRPIAEYFGIVPDIDLAVMRADQSLSSLTARLLSGLDAALDEYAPDCVVAQGDTTSVLCAALVAYYRRLPLVHVEAGLRTGDLHAPWPEEFNRRVASLASTLHCAPTERARQNLLGEGVGDQQIVVTGNTVVDALLETVARERQNAALWAQKYPLLGDRRMVLVTAHRRESHGSGLEGIFTAVVELARRFDDVAFVCPIHPNPQVRESAQRLLQSNKNILLLAPVAYPEFVWLMDRSTLIVSDSGGVQEEAPCLGKRVLVTRGATERQESVDCGSAKLVGCDVERILSEAKKVLDGGAKECQIKRTPYGDGHAAKRTVAAMSAHFSVA